MAIFTPETETFQDQRFSMLLYGAPGVGKTTLACSAPKPLLIDLDTAELERLKTFEKDTLTKETNAKKTAALTKLYKSANAADSVAKLLISGQDLEKLELDDKGELKNGTELLKKAKADYADLFGGSGNTGVPQANPDAGGNAGNKTPQTVY